MTLIANRYLTTDQVCEYVGLGRDGLDALVEKGYISRFRDKSRRLLYDKENIDAYFDKCKEESLII